MMNSIRRKRNVGYNPVRLAVCLALGFTVVSAARASDLTADKVTVNDTLFVGGSNATWNITNAIMGQWHMDDNTTNTTVVDSSGRGHTGTLYGGDNTENLHVSGKVGSGALSLDGANDYILVPDNNDFDFGTNSFSISAWIYPTDMSVNNAIVDKTSWDTYYPQYYFEVGGGYLQFLTYYQDYSYITSVGTVSTGVWSHVVAVRNCDGRHQIYINGQLDTEATLTPRNVSNTFGLAIGVVSRDHSAWRFHGKMDEVALFNKALTAGEVRGLYNEGLGTAGLNGVQYGIVRGELIFQGGTNRIDGCLSIGTNQPSAKLHVNGTIRADQGVVYSPPLGDVAMGSYTNGL